MDIEEVCALKIVRSELSDNKDISNLNNSKSAYEGVPQFYTSAALWAAKTVKQWYTDFPKMHFIKYHFAGMVDVPETCRERQYRQDNQRKFVVPFRCGIRRLWVLQLWRNSGLGILGDSRAIRMFLSTSMS